MRRVSNYRLLVGLVAGVLALALASQGVVLGAPTSQMAAVRANALPTGPDDPVWASVPVLEVPLMAQAGVPPSLPTASVSSVRLQALNDGQTIAFLVEWADDTRDAHTIRVDQFSDAAALQFGIGDAVPAVCMGSPGGMANLWHWKADWQEDIVKGFQDIPQAFPHFFKDYYPFVTGTAPFVAATDFQSPEASKYLIGRAVGNPRSQMVRTSPVEELVATGFGHATNKAVQNVNGNGVWENGKWRVMFTRPLSVQDADAPEFVNDKNMSVAVAVWNGANKEVGGRKQTSSFVTFTVDAAGAVTLATAAAAKPAAAPVVAKVTAPPAVAPAAAQAIPLAPPTWMLVMAALTVLGFLGMLGFLGLLVSVKK
jgi:hypothetical protein